VDVIERSYKASYKLIDHRALRSTAAPETLSAAQHALRAQQLARPAGADRGDRRRHRTAGPARRQQHPDERHGPAGTQPPGRRRGLRGVQHRRPPGEAGDPGTSRGPKADRHREPGRQGAEVGPDHRADLRGRRARRCSRDHRLRRCDGRADHRRFRDRA
jgi:hypothetical protein